MRGRLANRKPGGFCMRDFCDFRDIVHLHTIDMFSREQESKRKSFLYELWRKMYWLRQWLHKVQKVG
jgi:hypothetical protein